MAGNASQGDTDKDSRDSKSSSAGGKSSSSAGGNKSQGDTDKGSRDSKSSAGFSGGNRSQGDSDKGSRDSASRGGSGGGNRSQGDSDKGSRDSRSASIGKSTGDRSKTEATKDRDAGPYAAARDRNRGRFEGNAGVIAGELADRGWSDHQIEGALGRLQQESSLNPNAQRKNDAGPGLHSYGIGQWNQDRLSGLDKFAEARGKTRSDLATQAQYIDHEMRTKESKAWGEMQKATTRAEAATAMMHYERPAGYTSKNPAAGHGYNNTLQYAEAFGSNRGLVTRAGADANSQAVASTSTAHQTLGGTTASYVDPMVSTVASREARGKGVAGVVGGAVSAIDGLLGTNIADTAKSLETKPEERERLGLGKLAEKAKAEDGLGVVKEIASAVRDPIGFVLDSIEDGWNQNGGLKGLGVDAKGFNLDFNFGGSGAGGGAIAQGGDGGQGRISQSKSASAFAPVQEAVASVASVTPTRKPFGWSTL